MEPVTIVVACTIAFGVVTALSAFVRQLVLSRDKKLNEKSLSRALSKEAKQLEKMRQQMESNRRFDAHYQVLGANKDGIQYLDEKIEDILQKKLNLIQRYAQVVEKESASMIDRAQSTERKTLCGLLKDEIDRELNIYETELQQLQARRSTLWDAHHDLQDYLVAQEISRNEKLDQLYHGHTGLLEKIYMRHNESNERVATQTIDAGTLSFKYMLMAPVRFLSQYFKASKFSSLEQFDEEKTARSAVNAAEKVINGEKKHAQSTKEKLEESASPQLVV